MIQIATIFGYEVNLPERGSEEAAGLDIYLPQFNLKFEEDFNKMNEGIAYGRISKPDSGPYISIPSLKRVILPTGLRVKVEPGTYLEVANRGSMAAKYGLIFGAHIIDSDYRGNVFINLINVSAETQKLDFGQKIAQILHKSVLMDDISLVSNEEYDRGRTKRGAGALGSTGR
jgi:dUTP pyrophosphatase